MSQDFSEAIAAFIQRSQRLPTLPVVVQRVLRMVNDPDVSIAKLVGVIGSDQSLSLRLLRLANSAFYGLSCEVVSVRHAVVLLGLKTVRSLVLAIWTQTYVAGARANAEMDLLKSMFLHGLAAAAAASDIGGRLGKGLEEDCFVGGLLHDIGKVALIANEGDRYQREVLDQAPTGSQALLSLEQSVWGFDHAQLGQALLTNFKLPAFLAQAVGQHHAPTLDLQQDRHTAAVTVGNVLAAEVRPALPGHALLDEHQQLREQLGLLEAEACDEFVDQCHERVAAMVNDLR